MMDGGIEFWFIVDDEFSDVFVGTRVGATAGRPYTFAHQSLEPIV